MYACTESSKHPQSLTYSMQLTFILGFRRDVDKICTLLEYYTASCGNYSPTFRDNISVPTSRAKSFSSRTLDP